MIAGRCSRKSAHLAITELLLIPLQLIARHLRGFCGGAITVTMIGTQIGLAENCGADQIHLTTAQIRQPNGGNALFVRYLLVGWQ